MFNHNFKLFFRNILARKTFSLINLSGLAVGIACTLLIVLWVKYELDYNNFHENYDRICRVVGEYDGLRTPTTAGPMAAWLQSEIPEVELAVRFKNDGAILTYGENSIRLDGINAEPAFLDVFTFPLISGDAKTALDDVGSIVLVESAANKLFGNENPIGKVVKISNRWTAKVAAVLNNVPQNSSPPLRFEYLSPFKIYSFWREPDSWTAASDYQTWIKLTANCSLQEVNEKIDALIKKHNPDPKLRVFLQPLEEIHLRADCHRWDGPHGDIQYVILFSLLAVIILAIACINFMNLSTARSMVRAREVGIRKAVGAGRGQLIMQFFGESFFFVLLSLPFAALLVELVMPYFNDLAGHILQFSYDEPWLLISLAVIILVTGFFSGLYPAVFLSTFSPVKVLKNVFIFELDGKRSRKNLSFRKILVTTQFALAIIVIIGTLTIYNQLTFIRNKNLGFDKENLIYLTLPDNYGPETYHTLKNELKQIPGIISAGGSGQIPTDTDFIPVVTWQENGEQKGGGFPAFSVDDGFLETYKMELTAGRFFSAKYPTDLNEAFVVNEAAVKKLGYEQPLGSEITVYKKKGKIIGVVKNFHFETFRDEIEPLFMMKEEICHFLNIRLSPGNVPETLARIEELTKKQYPGAPYKFSFIDQVINELYVVDQRTGRIFTYFSVLAIFISCLGLFGLVSFIVERKTKELGIRKVLGASVRSLVYLLSKEFLKGILLANILAWPIAWIVMNNWLDNFVYKIDLGIWIFVLAGGLVLLIAMLTVSMQSAKAAVSNPVKALRYE